MQDPHFHYKLKDALFEICYFSLQTEHTISLRKPKHLHSLLLINSIWQLQLSATEKSCNATLFYKCGFYSEKNIQPHIQIYNLGSDEIDGRTANNSIM